MQTRRSLLLLPLALAAGRLMAADAAPALPPGACPLNSGGPSLLGSKWRLFSVYGHETPPELEINMEVGENTLTGNAGYNNYTAKFKRVGHTGFMMTGYDKDRNACNVLPTVPGGPTINVGSLNSNSRSCKRKPVLNSKTFTCPTSPNAAPRP
jgi:hypothetical protein